MYKSNGNVTYNKQEHYRIVKKYFNNHFDQKKRDIKNYPKKLTAQDIRLIQNNIDNTLVSTNKACSSDGVKGSAIERPKLIGKNKTTKGYKRIKQTINELNTQMTEKNQIQLERNQKIYPVYEKQKQQQTQILQQLIGKIVKNPNKWPQLFSARQIYIPKTDDRSPETCRPITILPTTVKLIETAILKQIKESKYIQKIDHRQTGFMSNRSTTFNLLRLQGRIKQLLKRDSKEIKQPIIIFYDFKSAFDSPLHTKAWQALKQQGYPLSIIKQIFWLYGQVQINQQSIGRGFLQGGITSPRLYIQYQQQALREIQQQLEEQNIQFDYLAFADDLALIIKNIDQAERIIQTFIQKMEEYGLMINQKKTEYITISSRKSQTTQKTINKMQEIMTRNNIDYQHTDSFKYLGLWIQYNGNVIPNQQQIVKKMSNYDNILRKISFITRNATMIINTWTTFVRAQFQYGLTIIKESRFKGTWKFFKKKYYQSLAKCLGLYRVVNGESIANNLNIATIEQIEKQYKKHILKQIQQLTIDQKQFYQLEQIETDWSENTTKQRMVQLGTYRGNFYITEEQLRHATKQLLNYEGSTDVIQKIFKLKSHKQKRYLDEEGLLRLNAKQLLLKRYKLRKVNKILKLAQDWNLAGEFHNLLKDKSQEHNININAQSKHKDSIYGITKETLQFYLQNQQNKKYPFQKIKNINLQPVSTKVD